MAQYQTDGEFWITVAAAAKRLGVSPDDIHRRAPHHIETRRLGEYVCIRESDVEKYEKDGLPFPHLEALSNGERLYLPADWYEIERDGKPYAFVALKAISVGPGSGRPVQPGDIISAGAGAVSPLDRMESSGMVAALPLDRGVLALLKVLLRREGLQADAHETVSAAD